MSGIAEVLLNLGYGVSGSDLRESEVVARLRALGAHIDAGHRAGNVDGADVVVVSTAVPESNPEVARAHALGVPVIPRAEMLAELMRIKYSVAVAGAHGKTTTTSMVGEILAHGGLDPTVIVGGRLHAVGAHARLGQGQFVVAEADESDGSFLLLSPTLVVITNIDEEHLDYYRDLEAVQSAFVSFSNRVPFYGSVILPIDDPAVVPIRGHVKRRVVTYGFTEEAEFAGSELTADALGVRFRLCARGNDEGWFDLRLAGRHNARNALAALVAGSELGIPYAAIREALHEFAGVGRRLESRGEENGVLWIDDYGHHPTEIRAALDALETMHRRRIVAVFQPHRYSRTRALLSRFAGCFAGVAELVLLPIYPANEAPLPGINSELLADAIRGADGTRVTLVRDFDEAARVVRGMLREGDLLVTIGAGDVYHVGELVRRKAA